MFVCTGDGTIRTFKEEGGGSSVPVLGVDFTYTGDCQIIDDDDYDVNNNWRIKFLSSGTFIPLTDMLIDAFCVGGGAGGMNDGSKSFGGGGGYTKTQKAIMLTTNTKYSIIIGSGGSPNGNGGETSGFSVIASGGSAQNGGSGGGPGGTIGGNGGTDGSDGEVISVAPFGFIEGGKGQGTTTREFERLSELLYSGGGGGGSNSTGYIGLGGAGGGGNGAYNRNGENGQENTGGGGGGSFSKTGGSGGSGIVIIRNHRDIITTIASASITQQSGVTYTDGLDGLSANEISLFSAAISNNNNITNETLVIYLDYEDIHRKVSIGDQVTIPLNGTNYAFDVIGFNHDNLTEPVPYGGETATGKAGITFQMHDCFATTYKMNSSNNNSGGWKSSAMRTSTMITMKSYMPNDWQSIIKLVNKITGNGGGSKRGTETVSDSCFLLAEVEIFGSISNSVSGEGTQYAYYKAGNSAIKNISGTAHLWWERSPKSNNSEQFCRVMTNGKADCHNANSDSGVAFSFCV